MPTVISVCRPTIIIFGLTVRFQISTNGIISTPPLPGHCQKTCGSQRIFHTNSPLPYTITTGLDDNGDTIFNDRPNGISRNSERGTWQKRFDASLSWQFNLGKNSDSSGFADPNSQIIRGKAIILDINSTNIFNQTNFQNFAGVPNFTIFSPTDFRRKSETN